MKWNDDNEMLTAVAIIWSSVLVIWLCALLS